MVARTSELSRGLLRAYRGLKPFLLHSFQVTDFCLLRAYRGLKHSYQGQQVASKTSFITCL